MAPHEEIGPDKRISQKMKSLRESGRQDHNGAEDSTDRSRLTHVTMKFVNQSLSAELLCPQQVYKRK